MLPTGRNRFAFDAALLLKSDKAAAVTATETTEYFDLSLSTAEWAEGVLGTKQEFVVVVHVSELVGTGTYDFALTVANADASGTGTFSATTVTAPGVYTLPITEEQILTVEDASKIAVTATIGGTTPSVKYFAYIAPFYGIGH